MRIHLIVEEADGSFMHPLAHPSCDVCEGTGITTNIKSLLDIVASDVCHCVSSDVPENEELGAGDA